MATQLGVYNEALRIMGEPPLSALTDNVPTRYALDRVWNENIFDRVGEDHDWVCFTTTSRISYNSSIEPSFGYKYAHDKPADLLKVSGIYVDEFVSNPLKDYIDEGSYWLCALTTIYVQYVRNSIEAEIASWPEYFTGHVAAQMAQRISPLSKNGSDQERIDREALRMKMTAESKDSMRRPSKRLPSGSWVTSKGHGLGTRNRPGDY